MPIIFFSVFLSLVTACFSLVLTFSLAANFNKISYDFPVSPKAAIRFIVLFPRALILILSLANRINSTSSQVSFFISRNFWNLPSFFFGSLIRLSCSGCSLSGGSGGCRKLGIPASCRSRIVRKWSL